MNLLILNGDSTSNKGDRAILLGIILLLRKTIPDAEIEAFSYQPERDQQWYGINFYDSHSLFQKFIAIRKADLIVWGGGELIQDDTSKVKIPYWFLNITTLSLLFRKKIVVLGQGLGPVTSKFNRFLARLLLNRLSLFITRDNYSETMMIEMGVKTKIISSYDPAILVSDLVEKDDKKLRNYLCGKGVELGASDKIVGVGVRRWFHQRGSWMPHKYAFKYGLRKIPGEQEFAEMKKSLAFILDELVARYGYRVVFFPMYTPAHEADDKVSEQVRDLMQKSEAGFVIKDDMSPIDYLGLVSGVDLFFGIRLHSTILSTSVAIPSLTFYYAPKGKSYYEQLAIPKNSFPIADLLEIRPCKKSIPTIVSLKCQSPEGLYDACYFLEMAIVGKFT